MVTPRSCSHLHVGLAAQEPEQLVDDRLQVQLLRRDGGEALRQIEARLVAEDRERAGAGAVALLYAVLEDVADEVEVLLHARQRNRWTDGL